MQDIQIIDQVICRNIQNNNLNDRGFTSQNILPQLRNFVETIAVVLLEKRGETNVFRDYETIQEALRNLQSQNQYKDLRKFHSLLQKSVSHYTVNEESSERLMLKYYEHLLKLKLFVRKEFNLEILANIADFPLNQDPQLSEYYEKIAMEIDQIPPAYPQFNERYYIYKIKPFFVNQKIYYEITFMLATNNTSKFERVIAFTHLDIMPNYAVNLSFQQARIDVAGRSMPIFIINDWEIAIRPCEFENFSRIFGIENQEIKAEEKALMVWLKKESINLVELINSSDVYYNDFKNCIVNDRKPRFFEVLDHCRYLVKNNLAGKNIIQYLLYRMNNKIIRAQYRSEGRCHRLSDLYLHYSSIPFDEMPFATSPLKHNPPLIDLLLSLDSEDKEHQFLARKITKSAEIDQSLFVNKADLTDFSNVDNLIANFNNSLYQGTETQRERKLEIKNNHVYISSYVNDCINIINKIKSLANRGLNNYSNSMASWIKTLPNPIDCDEKIDVLKSMFEQSEVALIYGAAGTGKTTLITYIAQFFKDKQLLFLTNTHTAKSNLERRIGTNKGTYNTIRGFLNSPVRCDILIIDEASTISNRDMSDILQKADFKLLLLVGDNYQIESIRFGNWFDIIRDFIPSSSVHELTQTYRSSEKSLLRLWHKVRTLDDSILETLVVRETFSQSLDESIFDRSEEDQIILCLNYDGLYGINNINRLLQENNRGKAIQWGIYTYKVGDPILFHETSERYVPNIIHNNLKGRILSFTDNQDDSLIWFQIELDAKYNEADFWHANRNYLRFHGNTDSGNTIVDIAVDRNINTDDDDLFSKKTMPFQIAYAVSIHKAQGLEYNSVKIVINNELDELITHNIFYTAITRAKQKLKIYWSPESENKILNSFQKKDHNKDIHFIKQLISSSDSMSSKSYSA